jgi:hypothetical protein
MILLLVALCKKIRDCNSELTSSSFYAPLVPCLLKTYDESKGIQNHTYLPRIDRACLLARCVQETLWCQNHRNEAQLSGADCPITSIVRFGTAGGRCAANAGYGSRLVGTSLWVTIEARR